MKDKKLIFCYNFHISRGKWGETKHCSNNMAICGVKVRMDGYKTALNGAMFQCCNLPDDSAYPYNLPTTAPTEITSVSVEHILDTRIAKKNSFKIPVFGLNGINSGL